MTETPYTHLNQLEQYTTNSPDYCITQGALYDWTLSHDEFTPEESDHLTVMLNQGEVQTARELVNEKLEP